MSKTFDKSKLDVSQIFLVFMATIGDVERTAAALDIDPVVVKKLSEDEGWDTKIRRISILSKSEKPGDWERAQNRALNFVQAHRFRTLIDRVLQELFDVDSEKFLNELQKPDKDGVKHVSGKFFSDMAIAIERCHSMTYMALGDTVTERKSAFEEDGVQTNARQLHSALISALNSANIDEQMTNQILIEGTENTSRQIVDQAVNNSSDLTVK